MEHEKDKFQKFLDDFNYYHSNIKYTTKQSKTQINFLDGAVMKKSNQLGTDFFLKPTDTHQYLHASSCHVSYFKWSLPYNEILKLNRIINTVMN